MQLSVCTVNNSLTCIHCSHDEALTVEEKRTYHHDYFPIPKVISLEYHAAIFLSIFSVNNSLTCMGRLHFNHSDLSMSENEVVNMFFFPKHWIVAYHFELNYKSRWYQLKSIDTGILPVYFVMTNFATKTWLYT